MTIRETIDLAKITSLGSYALKDDDKVVHQILNFSLNQVYSKLPILSQIQKINLVVGKTRYEYLDNSYKVLSAMTECGTPIAINDNTDSFGMFDMGNHVLDIPMCIQKTTNSIGLLLQMKPTKFTCEELDTIDFRPDDALIPAILSHMAYMVSKNISEENGVGHFNDFLREIEEVKRLGVFTSLHHSRTLAFNSGGWC